MHKIWQCIRARAFSETMQAARQPRRPRPYAYNCMSIYYNVAYYNCCGSTREEVSYTNIRAGQNYGLDQHIQSMRRGAVVEPSGSRDIKSRDDEFARAIS